METPNYNINANIVENIEGEDFANGNEIIKDDVVQNDLGENEKAKDNKILFYVISGISIITITVIVFVIIKYRKKTNVK